MSDDKEITYYPPWQICINFKRNTEGEYDVRFGLQRIDRKPADDIFNLFTSSLTDEPINDIYCCEFCGSLVERHVCKPISLSENEVDEIFGDDDDDDPPIYERSWTILPHQ